MIAAVVLAAGASTRMGQQKLLMPINGVPLVRRIAEQLSDIAVDRIVVVTGHDDEKIHSALDGLNVDWAHNTDWESGMLSSVRSGIRSVPEDWDILVALGDQPTVPPKEVARLIDRLDSEEGCIVVPIIEGRRGHPIGIDQSYREEILTHHDDVGLRGLLRAHADRVREVVSEERGLLIDLDTPEDYRRATGNEPSA